MIREYQLVLADGEVFEGEGIGADPIGGIATGEVVFNTVLSGYQEVITDPSYAGQIITFTYPHIGNYGVNAADDEAARPHCRGVVIRDLARRHSSWRAEGDLDAFLRRHGIAGIAGIDTRRLTRHIRDSGAMPGAFGTADAAALQAAAQADPGTAGVDLVSQVNEFVSSTGIIPLIYRANNSAFGNDIENVGDLNGWDSEYWNIEEWVRTG